MCRGSLAGVPQNHPSQFRKLSLQHVVEHVIDTGDGCPASHHARPLFRRKRIVVEKGILFHFESNYIPYHPWNLLLSSCPSPVQEEKNSCREMNFIPLWIKLHPLSSLTISCSPLVFSLQFTNICGFFLFFDDIWLDSKCNKITHLLWNQLKKATYVDIYNKMINEVLISMMLSAYENSLLLRKVCSNRSKR